eukprot:7142809-Pyramimonas_sp.AAC.1
MEGDPFSKYGSRLSAVHIRLKHVACVSRTERGWFSTCSLSSIFKDGGRMVFKVSRPCAARSRLNNK